MMCSPIDIILQPCRLSKLNYDSPCVPKVRLENMHMEPRASLGFFQGRIFDSNILVEYINMEQGPQQEIIIFTVH